MRFSENLREEILRRTDIVRLVGRRVKLDRKGRVYWGLCPFHKEKSPSFKVETERRLYHCFGCGAGGDAFKWLMETEGLSFPEAVEKLAGEAGVALPAWSPEDEARENRRKSLYDVVALAADFYEMQLQRLSGEAARRYLQGRGLDEAAQKRHRLGYAPTNSALRIHLEGKGVLLEDMIEAGLVRASEDGRQARDFFYDRVMFPIADVRGRVVAFGARALSADAKPKYINTGETALFSKGHLLYRFGPAREAANKGAPLIVAEGYMDVIALSEAGFAGAVAPLGTALTEDQLHLLWRVVPEPILCFDGDEAGLRAGTRASRLALPHLAPGHSLRFAFLPKGEDPDSFIRSQGAPAMQRILEKAQPLAEVLWSSLTAGKDFSTPERRAGLEAELAGLVKLIHDAKVADYYRREFEGRIFTAFKRRGAGPTQQGKRKDFRTSWGSPVPGRERGGAPAGPPVSDAVKLSPHALNAGVAARRLNERRLLGLLLLAPHLIEQSVESLAELPLSDPELDRLRRELLNLASSGTRLDTEVLERHLVGEEIGKLSERLRTEPVLLSDLKGQNGGMAEEALFRRIMEQVANPEALGAEGLIARRTEILERYLDGGRNEDLEALQRLNTQLRDRGRTA